MAYQDYFPDDPNPYSGFGIGGADPISGFHYDPFKTRAVDRAKTNPKASDVLNQYAPVPSDLTQEREDALLSQAADYGLGSLAAVGNFLDIPGSFVRDAVVGDNPFDQLLPWNWFNDQGRNTGRDVLHKWGVTSKNDPNEWEAADFGGFAAEVALDPLSWGTFGLLGAAKGALTQGGKLVSKMGKLGTIGKIAEKQAGNIGKQIGPRMGRRTTLKQFLGDRETALSMFPQSGNAHAAGLALRNHAEEIAGEGIRSVRRSAKAAGQRVADDAGERAARAVAAGADDATREAARQAAIDAAWEFGGEADRASKSVLRDTGKGIVESNLDLPLGGEAALDIPFYGTVGKPLQIDPLAKGLDAFGRYASESRLGQGAGYLFDHAAGGKFGKYAQAAMRASSHYKDQHAQKVYSHIAGLSNGLDEGKAVFKEFFGDEIAKWHAGVDPSRMAAGVSVGDIIKTDDMAAAGRIMGIDESGEYIIRYENVDNGAWEMVTRRLDDPKAVRIAEAGTEAADEFTDSLIEDALNSFMNASSEIGFEKALDSWYMGDTFDRLGFSGQRGKLRLIDRNRGQHMISRGLASLSPEQFQRLQGTVDSTVGKAHRAADALRDDLVSRGVKIGDIYDDAMEFDFFPRRGTPETLERLGDINRQENIRLNFLGDAVIPGGSGAKRTKDFSLITDTALGRTAPTAKVPKHVLERMYEDDAIKAVSNYDDVIERADMAADIEDIGDLIKADPEYKKYLSADYSEEGREHLKDLIAQGMSPHAAADIVKAEHAREIAGSVFAHRGKGRVYMPDMYTVFAKHAHQMGAKRALLDGVYSTIIREMRLNRGGPTSTVYEGLRSLGLDVHVKQTKAGKPKFGGQALKHLAKIMGVPMTPDGLQQIARSQIPEEFLQQLKGTSLAIQPATLKRVKKAIDTATGMFKSNVTLPFVSFGMRNLFSGQFVNLSSGEIKNAGDVAAYIAAIGEAGRMSANPQEYARILREIRATGIIDARSHFEDVPVVGRKTSAFAERGVDDMTPGGMFRGDESFLGTMVNPLKWGGALKRRFGDAATDVAANPRLGEALAGGVQPLGEAATLGRTRAAWNTMLGVGSDFNRHVEFTNRVPMYLYLRNKGLTPAAAAERIRDLQFDYSRLTKAEKEVGRRAVPFYAFSRKMGPLFFSTLLENPGGLTGQTIRGSRVFSGERGTVLPEYISGQTTLPGAWFGMKPKEEGAVNFVTGLGLAHENPLAFMSGLPAFAKGEFTKAGRRTFNSLMASTNPMLKGPAEYFTGHSFFQTGPGGMGRQLDEMDPVLGRLYSNIKSGGGIVDTGWKQFGKPDPAFGSPMLESFATNLPTSRYLSTARQLTDPRKGLGEKALNFLTGIKTTTLSPYQQEYATKQTFESMARSGRYHGEFRNPHIDRYKLWELYNSGKISKAQFEQALDMQAYYRKIAKKRRGSSEESKLRRLKATGIPINI